MASRRPLGIERDFGWAPTDDPAAAGPTATSAIYSAGRAWTPAGLAAMGHVFSVNLPTGGLTISAIDRLAPYYAGALRVVRTWDSQEQFVQADYLRTHPNTDPRPHLLGNWQLQQEAQIS